MAALTVGGFASSPFCSLQILFIPVYVKALSPVKKKHTQAIKMHVSFKLA